MSMLSRGGARTEAEGETGERGAATGGERGDDGMGREGEGGECGIADDGVSGLGLCTIAVAVVVVGLAAAADARRKPCKGQSGRRLRGSSD